MPTPVDSLTSKSTDKEINSAVGACIKIEKEKHPDWSSDKRVAVCFAMAEKKVGRKLGE